MTDHHGAGTMPSDHRRVIAIDGPAAAGKTTVARALADRVGAIFLDTGLLYRALTLRALRAGIDPNDDARLIALAQAIDLRVRPATVPDGRPCDIVVDGVDVTAHLREPAVDAAVSAVSAHAGVRQALLPLQREVADGGPVVMVGRDIGTVVIPDAGVKIYLDASLDERARRRHAELVAKGKPVTLENVHDDLARRDAYDSSRDVAPLRAAAGAIVLDTDGLTITAVVDRIARIVTAAWADRVPR